jgi:methylenetetrahydrofolate reductase (NADPH)
VRSFDDVSKTFVEFVQGKIKKFPFSEGVLSPETSDITEILVKLNKHRLLTINSQPRVNGMPSKD